MMGLENISPISPAKTVPKLGNIFTWVIKQSSSKRCICNRVWKMNGIQHAKIWKKLLVNLLIYSKGKLQERLGP